MWSEGGRAHCHVRRAPQEASIEARIDQLLTCIFQYFSDTNLSRKDARISPKFRQCSTQLEADTIVEEVYMAIQYITRD